MLTNINRNLTRAKANRCDVAEEIDCDTIDWLVDLLGTTDLLQKVIRTKVANAQIVNASARGETRSELQRTNPNLPDGLYFDGAHWYSVRDHTRHDSYELDFQDTGTAHFCQTFATMIFLGEEDLHSLSAGEYENNIKAAMAFWKKRFTADRVGLFTDFYNEIITSEYADKGRRVAGTKTKLSAITDVEILKFLDNVSNRAGELFWCKQTQ